MSLEPSSHSPRAPTFALRGARRETARLGPGRCADASKAEHAASLRDSHANVEQPAALWSPVARMVINAPM